MGCLLECLQGRAGCLSGPGQCTFVFAWVGVREKQNTPGPEVRFYSLLHIVTLSGQDGLGTQVDVDRESVEAGVLGGWVLDI